MGREASGKEALAQKIADVIEVLPASLAVSLASAFELCDSSDPAYVTAQVVGLSPVPRFRAAIAELCATWRDESRRTTANEMALALRAAALSAERLRTLQTSELIWTGPSVTGAHLRRTDQALLEVIESARHSLLVVSFAVYRIPAVASALAAAIDRGVIVRICLETPEPGSEDGYDTIAALGENVARRADIYIWPRAHRQQGPDGSIGHLHAKCAVADDRLLFITSANLTEYALNYNIELGVLIRQGALPLAVAAQFMGLIETGVLTRVR